MVATTSLATTKLIEADKGGVVSINQWAYIYFPPGSLAEDTEITAFSELTQDEINFYFEPSNTYFLKPAEFVVSWAIYYYVDSLILNGEDDTQITPEMNWWGLKYYINHFSLYYFRRR
jgi:hypothetical protein